MLRWIGWWGLAGCVALWGLSGCLEDRGTCTTAYSSSNYTTYKCDEDSIRTFCESLRIGGELAGTWHGTASCVSLGYPFFCTGDESGYGGDFWFTNGYCDDEIPPD